MRKNFEIPEESSKKAPEDYWYKTIKKIDKESDKIPDPIKIRAEAILQAAGIPTGPYSALEKAQKGETKEEWGEKIKRAQIIAEYLTNKPGVFVKGENINKPGREECEILSSDFRDIYPNKEELLPKLEGVLSQQSLNIIKKEYEHLEKIRDKFNKIKDLNMSVNSREFVCGVHYFRLPGGIDLFLSGYAHDQKWHKKHGKYLREINKEAKVICIEGPSDMPFGQSLDVMWRGLKKLQKGHYNLLMREAVKAGFNGYFTEVDARDTSILDMNIIKDLSLEFFENYFEYLKKENPSLKINSLYELRKILIKQSPYSPFIGIKERKKQIYHQGKEYLSFPYVSREDGTSDDPTYLELGQLLFSDALASIKLHLIAKLMADSHLEKGPIIDYIGTAHLPSKTFFLKYPQYAMEVVLRTIHELMAGKTKDFPGVYEVFRNPNWEEVVKEIFKLVFKRPEDAPEKSVQIGPNQRRLLDVPINFFETYNINPKKVIPSDEEIEKTRKKLAIYYGEKKKK